MSTLSGVRTTIRMTVVSVFILATLLTAAIAIGLQYYFSKSIAREAAADVYTSTAQGIAAELRGIGNTNRNIINLLADNPALASIDNEAALLQTFTQVLARNPLFYGIYIGDNDDRFFEVINLDNSEDARQRLHATPADKWLITRIRGGMRHSEYLDRSLQTRTRRSEPTDFSPATRPWFTSAFASGEVVVTDPYLFAQLGIPGRTVSRRVRSADVVVGIDLTMTSMSDFLAGHAIADESSIYLYNAEGLVLASSEYSGRSETVPVRGMVDAAQDAQPREQLFTTKLGGVRHLAFVTPLGGNAIFVGIVTPVRVLMAPFLEQIRLSIAITAALLLALLPLSWLFASPIVRPVRQLADENDKVRRREYAAVQRVPSRVKELDELSESMVSMVDAIRAYEEAQRELMDSFIRLIAQAIDDKSPYTGGHCERVPELALMLAKRASDTDHPAFRDFRLETDEQWREYRIAAWLHDCGKITTPEHIVDKGSKLETIYNRLHEVRMRFEVLWRDAEIDYLNALAERPGDKAVLQQQLAATREQLQSDFSFVAECNVGGEFMDDEQQARLREIARRTWTRYFDDSIGLSPVEELRIRGARVPAPAEEPLLADRDEHVIERTGSRDYDPGLGINMDIPEHLYNQGELYNLSISRGTLTAEDRFKINEHMISTIRMLESLPFPDELKNVPRFASTHHETIKGTGYPRKLSGDQLSIPERILAVADVFEALTAADRPYKKAKPVSVAVDILHRMVEDNHIDRDCFELFIREGVYREYAKAYLDPGQMDDVDVGKYLRDREAQ